METIERTPRSSRDQRFWHPLAMAFKGVAMAMAAVTIAFVILGAESPGTYATFLAVGLLAMGVGSLMDHR